MHHPFRFATLLAVTLAFTACTDSAQRAITEPDGVRLTAAPLSSAQLAVHAEIVDKLNSLYACEGSKGNKKTTDKNSDVAKMLEFALKAWWTKADKAGSQNVAYMASKLIADLNDNIAKGIIPASCTDHYTNVAARNQLVIEVTFLIRLFENQGEYQDGNTTAFQCSDASGCDVTGNGWAVIVEEETFGQDVTIIVRLNTGAFPDPDLNQVGTSWVFEVLPPLEGKDWKRAICWDGKDTDGTVIDPADEFVVMFKTDENGNLVPLPTEFLGTCTFQTAINNPFVRGAQKLLAGMPFFPKTLQAYSPPRLFGGTGKTASPHWLVAFEPVVGFTLEQLRAKTVEYYGNAIPNLNAALNHLDAAIAEPCRSDPNCRNEKLDSYISVVAAQTGGNKVLTQEQGEELIGIALGLKL